LGYGEVIYSVQQKGSFYPALKLEADGPFSAESLYRKHKYFCDGGEGYINVVWFDEDDDNSFYRHAFFFDEMGIIEVRQYRRPIS